MRMKHEGMGLHGAKEETCVLRNTGQEKRIDGGSYLFDVNDVRVAQLKMILNPTQQDGTIRSSCQQLDGNPARKHETFSTAETGSTNLMGWMMAAVFHFEAET